MFISKKIMSCIIFYIYVNFCLKFNCSWLYITFNYMVHTKISGGLCRKNHTMFYQTFLFIYALSRSLTKRLIITLIIIYEF